MLIGLAEIAGGYFAQTSQYYLVDDLHGTCSNYWWRNLLYISNLFPSTEEVATIFIFVHYFWENYFDINAIFYDSVYELELVPCC